MSEKPQKLKDLVAREAQVLEMGGEKQIKKQPSISAST